MTLRGIGTMLHVAWRLQRFEVIAVAIGAMTLAAISVYAGLRLTSFAPTPECQRLVYIGFESSDLAKCPNLLDFVQFDDAWTAKIMLAATFAPFLIGLVLGAPVVSREIEQRTAELAWSLTPQRARWLCYRALFVLVAAGVLALMVGAAAEWLEGVRLPAIDPSTTFVHYGSRGPLLVSRALVAMAIAVFAGAVIGRTLPALLVAAVVCLAAYALFPLGAMSLAPTEAVPAGQAAQDVGALQVTSGWRTPSGAVLSESEARSRAPNPRDPEATIIWLFKNYEPMSILIPGQQAWRVAWTEGAFEVTVAAVTFAGTALALRRRRPY